MPVEYLLGRLLEGPGIQRALGLLRLHFMNETNHLRTLFRRQGFDLVNHFVSGHPVHTLRTPFHVRKLVVGLLLGQLDREFRIEGVTGPGAGDVAGGLAPRFSRRCAFHSSPPAAPTTSTAVKVNPVLRVLSPALLLLVGLTGCAPGTRAPDARESTALGRIRGPLDDPAVQARLAAWRDVRGIAAMFATAPADDYPGLAALAADVENIHRRIRTSGTPRLYALSANQLVNQNPHFWRASIEVVPSDPVIPFFAALVHLSAGQPGVAYEILSLVRAGPLLPEPLDRLVHHHRARTLQRPAPELTQLMQSSELSPAELVAQLEQRRRHDPDDPLLAHALIAARRRQAGLVPWAPAHDDEPPAVLEAVLADSMDEVELLNRAWPLIGLLHRREAEIRRPARAFWPGWANVGELRSGWGAADFDRVATLYSRGGYPAQAVLARRMMAAVRGFGLPSDFAFTQFELSRLLPDDAPALLAAWDEGDIRTLAFFGPDLPPTSHRYRPLHPVMAETLERMRRTATYALETPIDNPVEMSGAYAQRSDVMRQLGRLAEAEEDLGRLRALEGASLRVGRLQFLLALDRSDAAGAAAALATITANLPPDRRPWREEGLWHALQGEWAQAGDAFARLAEVHRDPEAAGFAALHAIAAYRWADHEVPAELWGVRERAAPDSWIDHLLTALAEPSQAQRLLAEAQRGTTELDRIGRRCEALLVLALNAPRHSPEATAQLEACVQTGVTDFVEYKLVRILLRQLNPERWVEPPVPDEMPAEPVSPPPLREPLDFEHTRSRRSVPA
jgi:hypothetical protein